MGAWQALRRDRREALIRWVPKCPLDFGALLNERFDATLPRDLPITLMVGTQTQRQTRRIAELLERHALQTRLVRFEGAGHLGPFTLRDRVAGIIGAHLQNTAASQTGALVT